MQDFTWQFEKPGRSQFWNNFDEAVNCLKGSPVCVCKGCRAEVGHPARNVQKTTTTLKRHSESCEPLKRYLQNCGSSGSSTINQLFAARTAKGQNNTKVTLENIREEVLRFFISGNIPFSQADNPHFRRLMQWVLCSDGASQVTLSRKTVRMDLTRQGQLAKADLKSTLAEVDSKISLALDCWTSRNGFAFLGNTLSCNVEM